MPLLAPRATAFSAALAFVLVRATVDFPRGPLRGRSVALGYVIASAFVALNAWKPELSRFESQVAPFAPLGKALLVAVTDLDGDGASRAFGLDCDDIDPSVAPHATDIPDDGVDQNCRGGDARITLAMRRFAPGGIHVPDAARSPRKRRPSVFFVTIDAWRADAFGRELFPRTSAWADRCVHFSNARATASYTAPSLVALHTGVFARHLLDDAGGWQIALAAPERGIISRPPTLAASLAVVGRYRTAVVFPPFHSQNFSFLTGYVEGGTLPDTNDTVFPLAETAFETARAEIARAERGSLHLRIHLMDLHTPYRGGAGRRGYLRSALSLDEPLAAFLSSLPADAVVVLTADHGEAFGEHGAIGHGHTLFDEELRVPLVLCAPEDDVGPPRTIETAVSLVDVTPTLMDLAGVQVPYRRHGESLVPLLRGGTRRASWVFAENGDKDAHQLAVVDGCDKLVEDGRAGYRVLFDVCADPEERRDLARAEPARAERMQHLLAEIVDLDLDAIRSWRVGRRLVE
ncbi:MAG: sulfatase-like hydrolase/transferase [Labilithrix sp.]|nr:sulfatase-like hydrolase/transferase [Labilithrix sp.]MCW5814016.1 sulfatase-like hydrolase/transferase [Labilithrix sp.]